MKGNIVFKRIAAFLVDYLLFTIIAVLLVLISIPFLSNDEFKVTTEMNFLINLFVFTLPVFKDSFKKTV
ncbi:hypothetical protein [Bacillus sp. 2205SS5-2]|uniref:hypothetical protein n=1 Tax=Bacillus sp. 2205SS5-2 TaxID=3109031 RepID=UPI0030044EDB